MLFHMDWSCFGCTEPEPEPEPLEQAHFNRSRGWSRNRRDILLGAGAEIVPGAGAGADQNLYGSAFLPEIVFYRGSREEQKI